MPAPHVSSSPQNRNGSVQKLLGRCFFARLENIQLQERHSPLQYKATQMQTWAELFGGAIPDFIKNGPHHRYELHFYIQPGLDDGKDTHQKKMTMYYHETYEQRRRPGDLRLSWGVL